MRAFLAIELPDDLRAALAGEQERLRTAIPGADRLAWVRPESLHLTLKFLGNVEEGTIPELCGALASQLCASPIAARAVGAGAFPSGRHATLLWAGVEDGGSGDLAALAAEVDVVAAEHGFAREERAFRAHVTLARVRRGNVDVDAAMSDARSRVWGSMDIEAVILFESRPGPGGSTYVARARIPLSERVERRTHEGASHGT